MSLVTTRATLDDDWGEPVNLGHPASDHYASDVSADGSTLYFMSDRPGGYGIVDLWQVPIHAVTAVESSTWGQIKSLFRE